MKAVGLITEYNPLHNGHVVHLNKSLELTNADVAVAVMSGNFAQRGEPAIVDKYTRASMAVDCGVNLVVELPVRYALGSAEKFAQGAILTLNALGVDSVCFGSEAGSIRDLDYIAGVLASEPDKYQLALKKELKTGVSFPVARENAICSLNIVDKEALHNILSSPNNILGIEYLKAIKRNACPIDPFTYRREGMAYNAVFPEDMSYEAMVDGDDVSGRFTASFSGYKDYDDISGEGHLYSDDGKTPLASSEALRREIRRYYTAMEELASVEDIKDQDEYDARIFENNDILQNIIKFIPAETVDTLFSCMDVNLPVYKEDFNELFNARMRSILASCGYNKRAAADILCKYEGMTENIASRIINKYDGFCDIDELIESVKDKSLTYKAISRAIFRFILNHNTEKLSATADDASGLIMRDLDGMKVYEPTSSDTDTSSSDNEISYVRILALDEKGKEYLNQIRKSCPVPLITKTAGNEALISEDIFAADIYNLAVWSVFGETLPDEFHKGIYIKGQGFTGESQTEK